MIIYFLGLLSWLIPENMSPTVLYLQKIFPCFLPQQSFRYSGIWYQSKVHFEQLFWLQNTVFVILFKRPSIIMCVIFLTWNMDAHVHVHTHTRVCYQLFVGLLRSNTGVPRSIWGKFVFTLAYYAILKTYICSRRLWWYESVSWDLELKGPLK